MSDETDELLIQKYQDGNTEALEELYSRYQTPLFNYLARSVKDTHSAEDILQEIFVKVIKKAGSFSSSGSGSFRAWIYMIATNLCRDKQRRITKAEKLKSSKVQKLTSPNSDETKHSIAKEYEKIDAALETLAPEQKEVLMLRVYSGLSFKEISKIQDAPLNTVLARMHYALNKLRQQFPDIHRNK